MHLRDLANDRRHVGIHPGWFRLYDWWCEGRFEGELEAELEILEQAERTQVAHKALERAAIKRMSADEYQTAMATPGAAMHLEEQVRGRRYLANLALEQRSRRADRWNELDAIQQQSKAPEPSPYTETVQRMADAKIETLLFDGWRDENYQVRDAAPGKLYVAKGRTWKITHVQDGAWRTHGGRQEHEQMRRIYGKPVG